MNQALEGVKVLDFTHLLQGPFATQMLGDLGADVIKVERNGSGDMFRHLTLENYKVGGVETPSYLAFNRNKRSLAIDLKSDEGKRIIYQLAASCDVVVQNFRPGVLDKLGYGYEDFKKFNPRIIYCSGSGYGEDGPYVNRPGQDLLIQALSGLAAATGSSEGPPVASGSSIADQLGAYHMVYGILAALYYREKTGRGQKIEVNLLACTLAHQLQEFTLTLNRGENMRRPASGIGHPGAAAPFGLYKTSDNSWIALAMSPMSKVAEALNAPALLDWDDPDILFARRDEVFEAVQQIILTNTKSYWIEKMLTLDIWCAELKNHLEAAEDPQVKHLNMITSYEHPKAGTVKTVNIPVTWSETPGRIHKYPPAVGEDTRSILKEIGLSEEEIKALIRKQVVTSGDE